MKKPKCTSAVAERDATVNIKLLDNTNADIRAVWRSASNRPIQ